MSVARWWRGPVQAEPDFENLLRVLRREKPDRPTLFELFHNGRLWRLVAPEAADWPEQRPYGQQALVVRAYRNMGYDYATIGVPGFSFPAGEARTEATKSLNDGVVITGRAGYEAYEWLDPDETFDPACLDALAEELPEGMKLAVSGPMGVLENVINLVGYDNLCFLLADDPDLVGEIFDAVGSRLVRYYQLCLPHPTVGAIIGNDDWGFKTQTMLSPADMRRYVFGWHKRIVEVAHAAGRPAILHSCGDLSAIMDDVIDDIGYDAKHSYEDTIQPVEEAYETYHDRIAVLGGIDVDFVVRSTPEEVYERSKAMLERAADRGAYALGTGNSVPEYVPDENFLALISAAIETR